MSEMNIFHSTDWLIYNASISVFNKSHVSLFPSERSLITYLKWPIMCRLGP